MAPVTLTIRGLLPTGLRARLSPERALIPYDAIETAEATGSRVSVMLSGRRRQVFACSDELAAEELVAEIDAILHPARTRLETIDSVTTLRQTLAQELRRDSWIPQGVWELLLLASTQIGVQELFFEHLADGSVRLTARHESLLHPLMTVTPQTARRLFDALEGLLGDGSPLRPGTRRLEIALPHAGKAGRVARGDVTTTPSHRGTRLSISFDDTRRATLDLADLGFSAPTQSKLERAARLPRGLIVVAGLTASGRTTTLSALLRRALASRPPSARGVSLETTYEVEIPGVTPFLVDPRRDEGMATILRRIVDEEPAEIIAIGELRDAETTQVALEAATAGHLVLATFHARTLTEAVVGLQELDGGERLDNALAAVISQRLVRHGCEVCAGRGCARCDDTGFAGLGAHGSVLLFTLEERDVPREGENAMSVANASKPSSTSTREPKEAVGA